jgi:hypothetical protein
MWNVWQSFVPKFKKESSFVCHLVELDNYFKILISIVMWNGSLIFKWNQQMPKKTSICQATSDLLGTQPWNLATWLTFKLKIVVKVSSGGIKPWLKMPYPLQHMGDLHKQWRLVFLGESNNWDLWVAYCELNKPQLWKQRPTKSNNFVWSSFSPFININLAPMLVFSQNRETTSTNNFSF